MAAVLQPISQKQFKVLMDKQEVLFTKCTAPSESFDTAEYNDGETGQTLTHVGFLKIDRVTLTVNYDPVKHAGFVDWYQGTYKKSPAPVTVAISMVNNDVQGTPLAGTKTLKLVGCKITKFKYPQVDRESSGMATLEVELIPISTDLS